MGDADDLRDRFLGWQCRLRQISVRDHAGRPGPGMTPRLAVEAGDAVASSIVVGIVEKDPVEMTHRLRHISRQTHDPRLRTERALALLGTGYFQFPRSFSDVMTALFDPGSATAACLTRLGQCVLGFEQYSQHYRIPCAVRSLSEDDPSYQATWWHNQLFSPGVPPGARVLAFRPDWKRAHEQPER